jgi:ubiquinone/menaquinone biosynthesis C-methylase UbiE
MGTETIEEQRRANYEIAEAVALGWERRRASIEQLAAPARAWMVRELAPSSGDVVLELAAGVGDTGFEAAEIIGEAGRLISTDFSPAMLAAAVPSWASRTSITGRSTPSGSSSTTTRSTLSFAGSPTC